MIVYSDFQCPYCRSFAQEVLPQVETDYVSTGKLLLAFRHFPLPNHALAPKAAVAVECAGKQGRFWEMHDRVFAAASLDDVGLASFPGLDAQGFDECLRGDDAILKVRRDVDHGRSLGVASTPSFLLGRKVSDGAVSVHFALTGAKPMDEFRETLDRLLR